MKYWWKIRIYNGLGQYAISQIETEEGTSEIDAYMDFYKALTGCRIMLEGMSQTKYECLDIHAAFNVMWRTNGSA